MSIHYKFKSNLNFDTLSFDGLHISVGDLKKAIIHQKRLGKVIDYDLQVTNAQTKEEYSNDSYLIPKNTSLIISRVPISNSTKKICESEEFDNQSRFESKVDRKTLDLTRLNGSEEDKIQEMMLQSTVQYDPKSYQKFRAQSQMGEVPSTYKCNKCKRGGHWIKNCPLSTTKELSEIKRNTGIPRSFRDKTEKEQEINPPETVFQKEEQKIPEDLICSICKDLFVDAVMIPCCGSSFCDDCVRSALLESEDNECPDCKEKGSSPAALIPNRFLRNSVNAFRNENGYIPDNQKKIEIETNVEKPILDQKLLDENQTVEHSDDGKQHNDNNGQKNKTPENNRNEEMESDYEDNIIVKVPAIDITIKTGNNCSNEVPSYQENHFSGLQKNIKKDPGENFLNPLIKKENNHMEHTKSEMKNLPTPNEGLILNTQRCDIQDHRRLIPDSRMSNFQQYPTFSQVPPFPQIRGQMHGSFENFYNRPNIRPPMGYPNMIHPPMNDLCTGYLPLRPLIMDSQKCTSLRTFSNIYDGITAKLGTGIIDDPLEAFNRIMKEKEKQKEEKRRNIQNRRSRSKDRQPRRQFRSPSYDRRVNKQFNPKDSRLPRKRNFDKKYIQRHQRSNSVANSRSRSRSPLQMQSRSPAIDSRHTHYHRKNKNMEKKGWMETSDKNKFNNAPQRSYLRLKESKSNDLEPPPPGSDLQQFENYRKSRTRSTSLNRDEKYLKTKCKQKISPKVELNSMNQMDIHHYTPEPLERVISTDGFDDKNIEYSSPINTKDKDAFKTVSSCIGQEERHLSNNIAGNNSIESDKTNKSSLNTTDKKTRKDSIKIEKKNKERKKKKKEKEKSLKKKNKKDKKEKRSTDKLKESSKTTKLTEDGKKKHEAEIKTKNEKEKNNDNLTNIGQDFKSEKTLVGETPPQELKVSDSILDIQGYDTDFEDIVCQEKNSLLDKYGNQEKSIHGFKDTKNRKSENQLHKSIKNVESIKNNLEQTVVFEQSNRKSSPKPLRSVKERLGNKVVNKFEDTLHHIKTDFIELDNRTNYDLKRENDAWKSSKVKDKWNFHNKEKQKSPGIDYFCNMTSNKNLFQSGPKFQSVKREFSTNNKINDIKSVASRLTSDVRNDNPFRNKSVNDEYKVHSRNREPAFKRLNSSNASSEVDTNSDSNDQERERKLKNKKKHKKHRSSLSPGSEDSSRRKNTKNKRKHKIIKKKKKSKD